MSVDASDCLEAVRQALGRDGKQECVRLVSKAARRQSTRWWSITEACGGPRRVPGTSRGREARPSTRDLAPIDTNIGFVLAKSALSRAAL